MAKTFIKTSITNSKAIPVETKFAVSYIRVSTKAQTKEDNSTLGQPTGKQISPMKLARWCHVQ